MKATAERLTGRKFNGGQVVMTHAVSTMGFSAFLASCLKRHFDGDWGDCGAEDAATNDAALADGGRLFSVYKAPEGSPEEKVWVITEWDRSVTTILFPSDY